MHKNTLQLLTLFLLIPIIILTVSVISEPQNITQFAQETFSEPPIFGCLQVGEGNKATCASKLGITTELLLTLHDRPIEKQTTVYYGDRLKGSVKFTNVGDLPIMLNNFGLGAQTPDKRVSRNFQPQKGRTSLAPRQDITLPNASYKFKSPDPNKEWTVSSKVTTSGGEIPTTDSKQKITVNATCTALRIKELTNKDKQNLKTLCGKDSKSKLCSSKQYCEIFKGSGCSQPNLYKETPGWQCDPNVYLPGPEQDLLEELCKVYPDSDACKNFCERSAGSPLCPKKYIVLDTSTGKPVLRLKHPKAVYIHDLKDFPFEYPENYPKDLPRIDFSNPDKPPAGKTTRVTRPTRLAALQPRATVLGNQSANPVLLAGVAQPPAPQQPAPAPPPGPTDCGFLGVKCALNFGKAVGRAAANVIPAPVKQAMTGIPPLASTGAALQKLSGPCQNSFAQQVGTGDCNPKKGAPAAGTPATASPAGPGGPQGGQNGTERNSLMSDGKGGFIDKRTGKPVPPPAPGSIFPCNPGVNPNDPNAEMCSRANVADPGDEGYAPECASGRKDVNPNDDPNGAPQFACCLDATKYVPGGGFCGRKASVWVEPAGKPANPSPNGQCGPANQGACKPGDPTAPAEPKDYFGKVCSNNSYTGPNAHLCMGVAGDPNDPVAKYQGTPEGAPFIPGQQAPVGPAAAPPPGGNTAPVPGAPGTVGDNPDYKLESDPPAGYNPDSLAKDPNVSPQEKNCRDRARYYDRNSNTCMPIWGSASQCGTLGYAFQPNTQNSAKPGTCKIR